MTLAEQLVANSESTLKRVEIYSPVVEETVIQEEDTDPTPE